MKRQIIFGLAIALLLGIILILPTVTPTLAADNEGIAPPTKLGGKVGDLNGNHTQETAQGARTLEQASIFLPLIFNPEKIAFLVNPRGGESVIQVMNADGSDVRSLTEGILYAGVPIWSPDDAKIVFENQHIGQNEGDIYVMKGDGSNKVNITNHPAIEANPSWSPDGSRIVFERWSGGAQNLFGVELYTANADGSDLMQLTNNAQMDYLPA